MAKQIAVSSWASCLAKSELCSSLSLNNVISVSSKYFLSYDVCQPTTFLPNISKSVQSKMFGF